jgi:hypothetical protein
MRTSRIVVGLLGVAAATYGAVHLLDLGGDNLVATLVWVVAGVALHDGLLAPVCIVAGAVLLRLTHRGPPAPVVVGTIVLGTVSLAAVPVLGRFGARADNATLLDRSYVAGWFAFAGVVVVLVVVGIVVQRLSRRHGATGPG